MCAERNEGAPRIVVGVDGSAPSVAALRWAVRQAGLTSGTIDAVTAWQYPVAAGGLGWAPTSGLDNTDYAELSAKTLSAAIAEVSPPGSVQVRELVVEGNPAQAILDAAREADLLVVGNRGHGEFTDALVGSVSNRCVHHATCPVVVVHGTKHD
jgi:nucleotide-binding universal stress UspA family protein